MIFIFDAGGYYLCFNFLQNSIKREVREGIEHGLKDDELVLIRVPLDSGQDITWIRQGKEFRYKGEMFDVVKVKTVGEEIHYYCINDSKEQHLIAGFNHNTKKNNDKRMKYSFFFQYLPPPLTLFSDNRMVDFIYPCLVWQYKSNSPDIHSPPPRTV